MGKSNLKEKFDELYRLKFSSSERFTSDWMWNWITHEYTPAILEEFAKWRNGEFVLGECRAMIATHEAKKFITTLQEDKPRKKRGIGRSQE